MLPLAFMHAISFPMKDSKRRWRISPVNKKAAGVGPHIKYSTHHCPNVHSSTDVYIHEPDSE